MTNADTIKSLAIAYSAYNAACNGNNVNGMVVWGKMLIDAQQEAGVELYSPSKVREHIELLEQREAA